MTIENLPKVLDASKVGTYPALSKTGGGYVWDAVLEYRVWCRLDKGAADLEEGWDYFYPFADYKKAVAFQQKTPGAVAPNALILQREYIDEPAPNVFRHVTKERITEWPVRFLSRPRRTAWTIPEFLSPDAPSNRLDILRGLA